MDARDSQSIHRFARAASSWPGRLALFALTGLMGVLIGGAFSPNWDTSGGSEALSAPAASPVSPVRPQRELDVAGVPAAITETVQAEDGGYLVLRFEPTYRFVAVIGSSGGSIADSPTRQP